MTMKYGKDPIYSVYGNEPINFDGVKVGDTICTYNIDGYPTDLTVSRIVNYTKEEQPIGWGRTFYSKNNLFICENKIKWVDGEFRIIGTHIGTVK